ncbi:hypothetical protein KIW84_072123 [Lathyrus oleraceus]|uniref:Uncharacterized protein n=1 Tax=Pisum sativum TaxID=3888 RepID=A0A9D4VKM4_PEA|nr:hypothetical protein KIW84_072123 [Pisum sativum]
MALTIEILSIISLITLNLSPHSRFTVYHDFTGRNELRVGRGFRFLMDNEILKSSRVKVTDVILADDLGSPVPGELYDPVFGPLWIGFWRNELRGGYGFQFSDEQRDI